MERLRDPDRVIRSEEMRGKPPRKKPATEAVVAINLRLFESRWSRIQGEFNALKRTNPRLSQSAFCERLMLEGIEALGPEGLEALGK